MRTAHSIPEESTSRRHQRQGKSIPSALSLTVLVACGFAANAGAQTQSLAFTGGALMNPKVSFSHLGGLGSFAPAGPAEGGAVDRNYDDGFNRIDSTGNEENTTANWGFQSTSQVRDGRLVMSRVAAPGTISVDDTGDFVSPSGNLEYRGSLGNVGASDWGILIGVGYQRLNADASGSFTTSAEILQDSYSLDGIEPDSLPAAPYSGSADSEGPRIGSVPTRTVAPGMGGRLLNGSWDLETDIFPITGGLYLESQIAGRLNGVVSAGMMALIVNAEMRYNERSTIGNASPIVNRGSHGANEVLIGGFVQLGLDWALWEKASLVASARWQPSQNFNESFDGREAEIDFSTAFSVHAGVSFRF